MLLVVIEGPATQDLLHQVGALRTGLLAKEESPLSCCQNSGGTRMPRSLKLVSQGDFRQHDL